jgi:hypothetical protein
MFHAHSDSIEEIYKSSHEYYEDFINASDCECSIDFRRHYKLPRGKTTVNSNRPKAGELAVNSSRLKLGNSRMAPSAGYFVTGDRSASNGAFPPFAQNANGDRRATGY